MSAGHNHMACRHCFYCLSTNWEEGDFGGSEVPWLPLLDRAADVVEPENNFERYFSWKRCSISHREGTNNVPTNALTAMPNTTAVPRLSRLSAPAPVANSIGITPNTKASAVIMTGRKRTIPPVAPLRLSAFLSSGSRRHILLSEWRF